MPILRCKTVTLALPTELRRNIYTKRESLCSLFCVSLCPQLPIFPTRRQVSIFGVEELNFCVRHGNRWILFAIITDFRVLAPSKLNKIHTFSNLLHNLWLSPRPISIRWLNTLLRFHLEPINLLVFQGSYSFQMGYLILRAASRLDAFSVYPFRT